MVRMADVASDALRHEERDAAVAEKETRVSESSKKVDELPRQHDQVNPARTTMKKIRGLTKVSHNLTNDNAF